MKTRSRRLPICAFIVAVLLVPACASVPEPSGFLGDYSALAKGKNFKQELIEPSTDFSKYSKVKVNPVDLRFLDPAAKTEIDPLDIDRLAVLLASDIELTLSEKFIIVPPTAAGDKKTLVISPALTQVTTPIRIINVIAFLLPPPLSFIVGSSGTASFEAKITDGATGKLLAKIAEMRKSNLDIKSLLIGGFMKFAHAEAIMGKWSEDLLAFLESEKNPTF